MIKLDPQTQTLYQTLLIEASKPLFNGDNLTFKQKTIKGSIYIYSQLRVNGACFEKYVGPASDKTEELIQKEKTLWESAKSEGKTRARLVAMYLAGGGSPINTTDGKILSLVERSGVFLAGGVLVGTPAYNIMSHNLGVRWPSIEDMQTLDIDIASYHHLPIAIEDAEKPLIEILRENEVGVIEFPPMNHKHPSTTIKLKEMDYMIDILTPEIGRPSKSPIYLKELKMFAAPLRFMDYLIEGSIKSVVPYQKGLVVNIPSPARFALHKLVVSQRRPASLALKSQKDIRQAANVLGVIIENQPGELIGAYDAAMSLGGKFKSQLHAGIKLLPDDILLEFNRFKNEYF